MATAIVIGMGLGTLVEGALANGALTDADLARFSNFVLILTDDQSRETVADMPLLMEELAQRGFAFESAIVTNPSCAPTRASILAGGFTSRHTGVKSNGRLNGGLANFDESRTLATMLSSAGYVTGFVGKYIHGYQPGHVPPGWSRFVANERGDMVEDYWTVANVTYGRSAGATDEVEVRYSETPRHQYLTRFQTDEAVRFLEDFGRERFFLMLSYYGPHSPFIPEREEDVSAVREVRQACVEESPPTDAPVWMKISAETRGETAIENCGQYVRTMQAAMLQSVDRGVHRILRTLDRLAISDRTLVVFMADNGIVLGRRYLFTDKGMPQEGSIGVPLVIFAGYRPGRSFSQLVAADLDVPATILDLAGIGGMNGHHTQGVSLVPALLEGAPLPPRSLLIENYGYLNWRNQRLGIDLPNMTWSGLRTPAWKYVEHVNGDVEAYELASDPGETRNVAALPEYAGQLNALRAELRERKGLAIGTTRLPHAVLGAPYEFTLEAWGGERPRAWRLVRGRLPPGLSLDPASGSLSGTPTRAGTRRLLIRVQGAGKEAHGGEPESYVRRFSLEVCAAADSCS